VTVIDAQLKSGKSSQESVSKSPWWKRNKK
jgi:malate dehydrogenase (oxaloacetate-decarboxylating)(NADP+)